MSRPATSIQQLPRTTGHANISRVRYWAVPIWTRAILMQPLNTKTAHAPIQTRDSIATAAASTMPMRTAFVMPMRSQVVKIRRPATITQRPLMMMVHVFILTAFATSVPERRMPQARLSTTTPTMTAFATWMKSQAAKMQRLAITTAPPPMQAIVFTPAIVAMLAQEKRMAPERSFQTRIQTAMASAMESKWRAAPMKRH